MQLSKLSAIPLGLWLGVTLAFTYAAGSVGWRVVLSGVALLIAITASRGSRLALMCGCFIALGILLGSLRMMPLQSSALSDVVSAQTPGLAHFTVLSDPTPYGASSQYMLGNRQISVLVRIESFETFEKNYSLDVRGQIIGTDPALSDLMIGTKAQVRSSLREGRPMRGVAVLLRPRSPVTVIDSPPWWQRIATQLRHGLVSSSAHLSSDAAALLPGLTLGDTSVESEQLTIAMRKSGLAHLTAVSGANVAIVVGAVFLLTRSLGLRRKYVFAASFMAILAFAILVRFEPSVLRASVMACIGLVALLIGRRRVPSAALISAVTLLLCIDPWLALSWAFALSVSATAGIIWLSPNMVKYLRAKWPRLPKGLPEAVALTASAQVATAPLTAAFGTTALVVGVPANLLAAPAVPFITIGGLLVTFATPISSRLGQALATLVEIPTQWVGWVAHAASSTPVAHVPWPGGVLGTAAMLSVFALIGGTFWCWRRFPGYRKALVVTGSVTAAFAILGTAVFWAFGLYFSGNVVRPFAKWPPTNWQVIACDVDQGDAILFRSSHDTALIADVGFDPELVSRCVARAKVRTIPHIFLTHYHSDHAGALSALVSRFANTQGTQKVFVTPWSHPPPMAKMVQELVDGSGGRLHQAVAGDELEFGSTRVSLLWPPLDHELVAARSDAPDNDLSLVFTVTQTNHQGEELVTLVTGDIEDLAQGAVVRNWPVGLSVNLLKVPHHGSVRQDPRLPKVSGATDAVISVGQQNGFGHPHPKTLELLAEAGLKIHRTDVSGDIAFYMQDGLLVAQTRR